MQTIILEQTFIDNLKMEFNTPNIKEAIIKLYQFYMDSKASSLDIEVITDDDPDYQIVLSGREEYKKHPENFVNMDDIKWR